MHNINSLNELIRESQLGYRYIEGIAQYSVYTVNGGVLHALTHYIDMLTENICNDHPVFGWGGSRLYPESQLMDKRYEILWRHSKSNNQ